MAKTGLSTNRPRTRTKSQRRRGKEAAYGASARLGLGSRSQKSKFVNEQMKKRYGNQNWRKKVYGKNYKGGTVGKLNNRVKAGRSNERDVVGKIKSLKKEIAQSTGENTAALERRLAKAEANRKKIQGNVSQSKTQRDKYLKLRNKAVVSTVRKFAENPRSAEAVRKELVKKQIEQANNRNKNKKGKKVASPA